MEKTDSLNQELPFYLASPKHRFGGAMVRLGVEFSITFISGMAVILLTPALRTGMRTMPLPELFSLYFVGMLWSFFAWIKGQTVGHFILKMRVYSTDTGNPARWRHMALRCFLIPNTYTVVSQIISQSGRHLFHSHALENLGNILMFGFVIIDGLWILTGTKNQRLADVLAHTVVVNLSEPNPYSVVETQENQAEMHTHVSDEPNV